LAQQPAAAPPAPPATAAAAESNGLETVTVTAQKRTENIKEVPLSVTVIGGEQLQEHHIEDFTDLARSVPSLSFDNGGGAGLSAIELRGVSSESGAATVGIYLDDVSMTVRSDFNSGATEPKFFDVKDIEILRGPQGTLYGASSMGGTIKFISNPPDLDKFEGSAEATISGTEHGGVNSTDNLVLNIPLAPSVAALRIGFEYDLQSGYIDRYAPANAIFSCPLPSPETDFSCTNATPIPGKLITAGANQEQAYVFKAALKYRPDDTLVITPSMFVQTLAADDTSVYDLGTPLITTKPVQESGKDSMFVPAITVDKDFGWSDLTSITSYFWRHFRRTEDGTFYNSELMANTFDTQFSSPPIIPNAGFPGAYTSSPTGFLPDPATAFPNVNPTAIGYLPGLTYLSPTYSQYSEEIRLASKSFDQTGLPYTWIAGLYFADQRSHLSDQEFQLGLNALVQRLYGVSFLQLTGLPAPSDEVYSNTISYDERQYFAFGEVAYRPIPALTATIGLRYGFARSSDNSFAGSYYNYGASPYEESVTHVYPLTPKFALNYQVDDDTSVYANAVKGFRLGGANIQIPLFECTADFAGLGITKAPETYGPDSLWSYEIGTKSTLLDNKLSIFLAGYYEQWKNVQQFVFLDFCGFDFNTNAGNAEIYGTDLEMHYKVTPELTANVTAGYTHDQLTSVAQGVGATVGERLLAVPDWSATFGVDYTRSITDEIDGFARVDWDWTGHSIGAFSPDDPDHDRPVYNIVNASLGAVYGDLEVSLFAKNLFDMGKTIQRPNLLAVNGGYTVQPLTVGLTVSKDF